MSSIVIYAADIGSVSGGQFGWWRREAAFPTGRGGDHPDQLVKELAEDLNRGHPVALGFECPLWMDLPKDAEGLTRARDGEGNRAWSAGAGCGVLATGIVQTAWILRELWMLVPKAKAFLRWAEFLEAPSGLFLWEAFVTGETKATTHEGDAQKAADAFSAALPDPATESSVTPRGPAIISLIGAALLRNGWATDVTMLGQPCLVIRAR